VVYLTYELFIPRLPPFPLLSLDQNPFSAGYHRSRVRRSSFFFSENFLMPSPPDSPTGTISGFAEPDRGVRPAQQDFCAIRHPQANFGLSPYYLFATVGP